MSAIAQSGHLHCICEKARYALARRRIGTTEFWLLPSSAAAIRAYSTLGNCGHFAPHGSFMLCAFQVSKNHIELVTITGHLSKSKYGGAVYVFEDIFAASVVGWRGEIGKRL